MDDSSPIKQSRKKFASFVIFFMKKEKAVNFQKNSWKFCQTSLI